MKTSTAIALALVLMAPSAYAVQDNTGSVAGNNNELIQQTGTGNTLLTGSGAIGTATSNTLTANGGAGGNATANGGAGGSVIGSGNSSSVAAGGQGGRGGDGGAGLGVGIGGDARSTQNATTGNQSVSVAAPKRNAPALLSAGLVAGNDTCLGSSSAGITTPFGGITGGGTETDKDCVRIKMSRELTARGYDNAAVAMLCHNEEVRQAMATAGTPCASTEEVASSDAWQTADFGSIKPDNGSRNR